MARKKPHEEHENHERYLVTYSDLITLLLAFFIILYAMSSVDKAKVLDFTESLSMAFNHASPAVINFQGTANKNARTQASQQQLQQIKQAQQNGQLDDLKKKVDKEVQDKGLENSITTKMDKDGLHIILTNEILFESGQAIIKPQMSNILKDISDLLGTVPNEVVISGHTDDIPISTPQYPSNWELSTTRAVAVLKEVLVDNPNLVATRFSAAGYGQFHPIVPNTSDGARQKNRRVEILVKRDNTQDANNFQQVN